MDIDEYTRLSGKKTCRDCVHYAETKRFYHPRAKKEIYYSMCKRFKRFMCRAYGLHICMVFEDKEQTEILKDYISQGVKKMTADEARTLQRKSINNGNVLIKRRR